MKIPITIVSTIISIAFRMIPTVLQESGRIRKAQASRGVDYKNSHFKEKIKSMISLIVPLLVSSFQKAEDLSYAMDSRGYNAYEKRTRYRVFKIGFIDILMFLFFISFSILIYVQYNIHFINILSNTYASV
jgi:energy-coupling factor transport system permease protein